jgi:hypothetical protein
VKGASLVSRYAALAVLVTRMVYRLPGASLAGIFQVQ